MKSIFKDLLNELELRWINSNVDFFQQDSQDIYFITPNGFVNRFVQFSISLLQIEIIVQVIDLSNTHNRLMEHMMIFINEKNEVYFKRGQGVEFKVTDTSHVVDQIDTALNQLALVFSE
jgi:exoribonuclease R